MCLLRYSDISKKSATLSNTISVKKIVTLITLPETKLNEKTLKFTLALLLLFAKSFHICAP